jgi:hypothetical protein
MSIAQLHTHPVRLLETMPVHDVVVHAIAILEQPELCLLACFCDHSLRILRRDQAIEAAHDDQQGNRYLPHDPMQIEGAQLFTRLNLVRGSGCIGGPPAIVNAVLDALAPSGITSIDVPLRAEKIWSLL